MSIAHLGEKGNGQDGFGKKETSIDSSTCDKRGGEGFIAPPSLGEV